MMRPRVRSPARAGWDGRGSPPGSCKRPRESHHLPFRGPISGAAVIGADRVMSRKTLLIEGIEVTGYAVCC